MTRVPSLPPMDQGLTVAIEQVCDEMTLVEAMLALDGKQILELGCGRGEKTRAIAMAGTGRRILALEVDEVQHARNMQVEDLPNVRFAFGGAEQIPVGSASVDVVLMFKSLHHVPVPELDRAMTEIARVLRPGGLAYVSEPIFRGDFNEVLRIFHDESRVRREAFAAIERAVRSGSLDLVTETFVLTPLHFADFAEFERLVIGATHSRHVLDESQHESVRRAFARFATERGADFEQPLRIDLLRRPA